MKITQNPKRILTRHIFCFSSLLLLVLSCSENFSDNPKANQPPQTFISIFSENSLNPAISRQTLNWWGDDPDGVVEGFIYTFNPNAENLTDWLDTTSVDWTFTTETQETFTLTLAGTDTTFTFWVKAVDDAGAADPDGVIQEFNIINTRPIVEFPVSTDVPETTFTVAEFVWSGTDLDGDDTIARYQYVLDDTTDESAWLDIDPDRNSIVLDGLQQGEHVFFFRAVDLAGARSAIIRMPRDENDVWFVREPISSFLMVDDYNIADDTDAFYRSAIRNIVGPIDIWDIKSNGGALEPPTSRAFLLTLQLFDRVFWYGDTGPNLEKAQVTLPEFIEAGGKVLMSTTFPEFSTNQGDPLDFSPADSLGTKIRRLTRNQPVNVTPEYAALGFPELQVNAAIIPNVFPVVPKISSEVIYRLPPGTNWVEEPPMAVINADDTFVFFGLPIRKLNGQGSVEQLLSTILNTILTP